METEYEMSKICRCCRKKGPGLQSIFENVTKHNESLLTMLADCLRIQVHENDGLPEQLCAKCSGCVLSAYEFRKRYMESDAVLREYLSHREGTTDQAALLGGMTVKVELTDIKVEEVFVEAEPFLEGDDSEDDEQVKETANDSDYVDDSVQGGEVSSDDSTDATGHREEKRKTVRKTSARLKECPVCSRTFGRNYHLKRHILTHRNDIQCDCCEKRFSMMAYKDYRQHMLESHPGRPIQPYKRPDALNKTEEIEFLETVKTETKKTDFVHRNEAKKQIDDNAAKDEATASGEQEYDTKNKLKAKRRRVRLCPFCNRGFPSKYHLERHIRSHKNDTQCEFCNQKFPSLGYKDYRQHMTNEHPGMPIQPHRKDESEKNSAIDNFFNNKHKKEAICKICDTTFTRVAELRNHLKSHVDPTTFANVNIPTKPYLFQEGYVLENYLEHLVQQICKWDVVRFYQIVEADGEELELSDSDSEPDSETVPVTGIIHREHTCTICHQNFPRLRDIMDHFVEHHQPDELLSCRHCDQGFPNNSLLDRHLKQQCENTTKSFFCAYCKKKFMWQTSLNKHTQSKHGGSKQKSDNSQDTVKRFHCQVCNKSFAQVHHLRWHTRSHVPSERKFECPECNRKFFRKYNLNFHMKTHQEVREDTPKQTHLCSLCGRGFTSNYNYIVHMRRHTGERPFKCDMCDKGFPRSMDLKYHRRTHTGYKPNVCTICGKAFTRHNRLVRHMRVHTGARPYACHYCDRTFTQSNDLTLHIRRHTGEKPYSCPVCDERFIQGTALRTHQRSAGHFTEETMQPVSNYGRSVLDG